MKRLSLLPLAAVAAFAQTKPAPAAPVAPAAVAPATYAAPAVASASGKEAPLAPVATALVQANPAAQISIDDVLLVPHRSAGQKAIAYEWADANSQVYILWNNLFAAAQFSGGAAADAQTLASFGYMTPAFGAGASFAQRSTYVESVDNEVTKTTHNLTEAKLFGSLLLGANDLYGSLLWANAPGNSVWKDDPADPSMPKYTQRNDLVLLSAGLRHGPAAGQEGLGWNVYATPGFVYSRSGAVGDEGGYSWILNLDGQVGYAYLTDGITFLPGLDAYWHHKNAKANDDYGNDLGIKPSASVIVPVFEHWTLRGGASYNYHATLNDAAQGDPSSFDDVTEIEGTTGNFGLRYDRDRWAIEAQVSNGILASGPYFLSGQSPSSNFLARLGFTLNLK